MLIYVEGNEVFYETTVERAKAIYGFPYEREPDATLTDEQWKECEGMVRMINGELVYGYTAAEKEAMQRAEYEKERLELIHKLEVTDYIVIKISEGVATKEEYANELEDRAKWRTRVQELEALIGIEPKTIFDY